MSDVNLQPELTDEVAPAKKKCCGKMRGFFTREAKAGERVLNWKFGVLVVAVIAVLWLI